MTAWEVQNGIRLKAQEIYLFGNHLVSINI